MTLASVLSWARTAAAQEHPVVRLEYNRGPGTERCPDAEALQSNVAARLGYTPFQPDAAIAVTAAVTRTAGRLRARVEMRDAAGDVVGARDLSAASPDCAALADAMVLAMSIAIDPLALSRPATPPSPAPAVEPIVPVTASTSPSPEPPARPPEPLRAPLAPIARAPSDPVVFHASIGVLGSIGRTPAVTGGPTAQFGFRWRALSVGLEGRMDLLGSRTEPGVGTVTASVLTLSLVPCLRQRVVARAALLICAVGSIGVMLGTASGVNAMPGSTLYSDAGVRAGTEIDLAGPLAVRVHADLLATLTPTALQIATGGRDVEVWRSPPVSADVGLALVLHFP